MRTRESVSIAAVVLMLGLMVAAYVAGYVILHSKAIAVNDGLNPGAIAHYGHGGRFAEIFFWPTHQVDRRFRPSVWDDSPELESLRSEFGKLLGKK